MVPQIADFTDNDDVMRALISPKKFEILVFKKLCNTPKSQQLIGKSHGEMAYLKSCQG